MQACWLTPDHKLWAVPYHPHEELKRRNISCLQNIKWYHILGVWWENNTLAKIHNLLQWNFHKPRTWHSHRLEFECKQPFLHGVLEWQTWRNLLFYMKMYCLNNVAPLCNLVLFSSICINMKNKHKPPLMILLNSGNQYGGHSHTCSF